MHKLYKAGKGSTVELYTPYTPYINNINNIDKIKFNNKNSHNIEFNYINNKNSHNRDIILDEITEKFDGLIYKTEYKNLILSQVNYIFESYKSTNNGVITNESILLNKSILGGATIDIKNQSINDELINYCKTVNDNNVNDAEDIQKFVSDENGTNNIKNFNLLKEIIKNNKGTIKTNITISYNPIYDYRDCSKISTPINKVSTSKEFTYKKYNKDIIEAYEKHFLDNFSKWEKFIEKQKKYIEGLSIEEKRIIQDYTKPSSFDFYKLSKSREQIDIDKFNIDPKLFGDSFYPQINNLYPAKIDNYNSWLSNSRLSPYSRTPIDLTPDEWRRVLDKFIIDIDNIIKKAPIVTEILYCYRGVSNHYIKRGVYSPKFNVRVFTSNRLSSYTLDFNIALNFSILDVGPDNLNCVYRTAIMPFSRILYVAPLSLINNECEFISPTDSVFIYKTDESTNDILPTTSYNNIDTGYSICSKEDNSFKSLDTILFSTKQPDDYFTKILAKEEETINNLKTIFRSIETITDPEFVLDGNARLKELIFNAYTYSFNEDITIKDENRETLMTIINDLYTIEPAPVSTTNNFSIVTANLFQKNTKALADKITTYSPKIICTQETHNNFNKHMNTKKYTLKHTNGNIVSERIDFYLKNDSDITIEATQDKLSTINCRTDRDDLIITTTYNGVEIKIGIVHLCGGKYDEPAFIQKITEQGISTNNEIIQEIRKIKEEQIQKMIDKNVDIILGDFNSDIEHYLGTLNTKQQGYFNNINFHDYMIEAWNKIPFTLLKDNYYLPVCNETCTTFYTPHTSVYGTSPDAIYYKSTKLIVNDFKIIDLLTGELSDHNGIYADFSLITSSSTGGNYNKKSLKKK
jgi:hypothetical protein